MHFGLGTRTWQFTKPLLNAGHRVTLVAKMMFESYEGGADDGAFPSLHVIRLNAEDFHAHDPVRCAIGDADPSCVIGVNMDRSKAILEGAKNPDFRLPFDGNLPSNTIRVKLLAAIMEPLIRGEVPFGTYDVAEQSQSWRMVFNWHTHSTGLPEVKGMDEISSRSLKTAYRSRSIARDVLRWMSSLPVVELIYSPSMFELMFRVLAVTPKSVTESLAKFYKRADTKRKIFQETAFDSRPIAPAYFSDAMPGRFLENEIQVDPDLLADDALELCAWHRRNTHIQWLPESISELRSVADEAELCRVSSSGRYPHATWN